MKTTQRFNFLLNFFYVLSFLSIYNSQYEHSAFFNFNTITAPFHIFNSNLSLCNGKCYSYNLNFPYNLNQLTPINEMIPSFGSPSVSPGNLFIWSSPIGSEGVTFTNYKYKKGRQYCLSYTYHFNTGNNRIFYLETANIIVTLTKLTIIGKLTSDFAGDIPEIPSQSQNISLISLKGESMIIAPSAKREKIIFTANDDYDNLLLYSTTNNKYNLYVRIREISVCEIPLTCDIELKIESQVHCQTATLKSLLILPLNNLFSIKSYLWDLGDDHKFNSSGDSIDHTFLNKGIYKGSVTAVLNNKNDDCCSKRFTFDIEIYDSCNFCDQINQNDIKKISYGSFIIYSPSIPHNSEFVYKWQFSDEPDMYFYNREITKPPTIDIQWVKLLIFYSSNDSCCKSETIFRRN